MKNKEAPEWIWTDYNVADQYVEFRREFYLDTLDEDAELRISVDSNFAAYINGQFAGTGQFSDFPENKSFSRIDIADKLVPGKNVLCVLVHYCGQNHFSYIPGKAGLWFILNTAKYTLFSDKKTLVRISPSYTQNKHIKLTPQMGFVFEYDAAKGDNWKSLDYVCGNEWRQAVTVENTKAPVERPLKQCILKNRTPLNIIAQGVLKRFAESADETVAELMQHDFLSARRYIELFEDKKVRGYALKNCRS